MSQSFGCKCAERKKPAEKRAWVVWRRKYHRSAFNGYHKTPSNYSLVECVKCGALGQTKAQFVNLLKDAKLK